MNTLTQLRTTTLRIATAFWLLCLLSCAILPDGTEDSLEILPIWEKGETVHYEIVKTRRKAQGGMVTLNTTARTDLEIQVLSANDDGYMLSWTMGATKFDDPNQAKNPLIRHVSNLLKGYRIILEIDSEGGIIGVQNWKELKENSEKILHALTQELNSTGLDQATVEKMRDQVASMFATKQQVEQFCTRQAQLFFLALGIELSQSKPLNYEDQLPNPFGGEPFPARGRFTLKEVDRESGRAIVTWYQTVAPDDARRIMEKTIRELARRLGKPVPIENQLKNFAIEDTAEFVLEISSGWIHRLAHKRTTKSGGTSQEDMVAILKKTG